VDACELKQTIQQTDALRDEQWHAWVTKVNEVRILRVLFHWSSVTNVTNTEKPSLIYYIVNNNLTVNKMKQSHTSVTNLRKSNKN
jgi:hypothetical protein